MAQEAESVLLDDVAFLLARASALAVAAGSDALRPLELTPRAFATLTLAVEHDGVTQREISAFLRLDPSRVVAIVDDLEGRGWVSRLVGPGDRRNRVVTATAEGRSLFRRAVSATRAAEERRLDGLSPEARAEVIRVLRLLAFSADG